MEIWKTITDYPNYQVSNYGNVKNIRFNRILKCTITPYGYKVCSLGKINFINLILYIDLLLLHL